MAELTPNPWPAIENALKRVPAPPELVYTGFLYQPSDSSDACDSTCSDIIWQGDLNPIITVIPIMAVYGFPLEIHERD